jgi:hypothetical protein
MDVRLSAHSTFIPPPKRVRVGPSTLGRPQDGSERLRMPQGASGCLSAAQDASGCLGAGQGASGWVQRADIKADFHCLPEQSGLPCGVGRMSVYPDRCRQECKTTILHHLARRATQKSLQRLKDMLPIMFESYGILTLGTQRAILLECGLQPVTDAKVYGVSFNLEQALLHRERTPTTTRTWSQSTDPSTPATDQDAFRGNPAPLPPPSPSPMLALWLETEKRGTKPRNRPPPSER